MIDGLVSSWFYGSKREEKARRSLCFRKRVRHATIITVSQATPQGPGGLLDIQTEASPLQPFMGRSGAGKRRENLQKPMQLCVMESPKGRRKSK